MDFKRKKKETEYSLNRQNKTDEFEMYHNQKQQPDEVDLSKLVSEVQMKLERQQELQNEQDKAHKDHNTEHKKKNTLEEQRKRAQQEEEKYDQLLNSVQAQNLIKTVDQLSNPEKSKEHNKAEHKKTEHKKAEQKKTELSKSEPKIVEHSKPESKKAEHDKIESSKVEHGNVHHTKKTEAEVKKDIPYEHQFKRNVIDEDQKSLSSSAMIESVNINGFQRRDISSYISSQCEVMEEATARIDDAMEEYSDVTEYFTDIQKIEQAPDNIKKQIQSYARRVNDLSVDRRISKSQDNRLSSSAYHRMEQLQDEIPKGFEYMKKQESYYETVKRDMRMLEGEQLGYRLEARMLTKRQFKIRSFSIASMIGLILAFAVFIVAMEFVGENDYVVYYILIALLGAIIAVGLFALLRYTERQVLLTEIKLNKTTNLLNKTKIKYINAANTLDYEYSKYRVKSSYELEKKYQAYIQMKEDQKKVLHMTSILNDAEEDLEKSLERLQLYDTHIWIGQVKALYDPKEMVEVRHDLTMQRQKLRNLIEYNEKRIEEAKQTIKNITVKHPEYMETALAIIHDYEVKNRK